MKTSCNELERAWNNSLWIWKGGFVFLASCFTAAFVLQVLNVQVALNAKFRPEWLDYLTYALLGVAVLDLLMLVVIRRAVLKPGGKAGAGQQSAAKKHIAAAVLTTALLGSIGVYGLVTFVLARDIAALLAFTGIALAGMFWFRPNKERLLDLHRQTGQGGAA